MCLLVKPAGKYWRLDYRYAENQKTLALGTYPEVSLAKTRKRLADARERQAEGIDPGATKRAQKIATAFAVANTFEARGAGIPRPARAAAADGHGRCVFPSLRTGERPMSDNTVNAALLAALGHCSTSLATRNSPTTTSARS